MLALADFHGIDTRRSATDLPDMEVASELTRSCYEMYRRSPAGLAPEIVFFTNRTAAALKQMSPEPGDGAAEQVESDVEERKEVVFLEEDDTSEEIGGKDFTIKPNVSL